ncbi:MAG: S9 family peptidase [Chitinophagaceae bacterium]|nr:MAG: S9 family peptidase [Chitinophagaceae bacterium]
MKKRVLLLICIPLITFLSLTNCKQAEPMVYPESRLDDVSDIYFGVEVKDPFRWLEDENSPETRTWVKNQNKLTFDYLESIPFRNQIKERLHELWNFERFSAPFWKDNYYFFRKNDGMQNQSVLYVSEGISGEPRVFIDPNELSEDGTISLNSTVISHDAKYMAYSISKGGSDWNEIFVKDIESGKQLSDHIKWVKFSSIAWHGDGFYYSRFAEPEKGSELSAANEFQQVYYHKLGTPQSEDQLIHHDPERPLRRFSVSVSQDERFLILYKSEATGGNALFIKDTQKKDEDFRRIIGEFNHRNIFIGHDNGKPLVLTNYLAPRFRLVKIDPKNPQSDNWTDLIPESENVLTSVSKIGGKLISIYLKNVANRAYVHELNGDLLHEIELPALGSLSNFSGNENDNHAFFTFTSFTIPSSVYKYNVKENTYEVHFSPELDFDESKYETKQVFYESKDGTEIPMFIVHKKGIELDGNNPTMLYGYGGFNVSQRPGFSLSRLILLENNGVYAVANIRGGGEFGRDWHDAGRQLNRQNVFDDFIAAAEYLIDNQYTNSEKLALHGRSNGGLLVAAVLAQRPDLFKVALPAVGVLDMLRYHKFTIGRAWSYDYGTSEEEEHFHNLLSYSPLHNLKDGINYPATLVTTADHDDRVVPAHSYKFIAELQRRHRGKNPVLIRIDVDAGHGAGKPTSKIIEEQADIWSFIFYNMNITPERYIN